MSSPLWARILLHLGMTILLCLLSGRRAQSNPVSLVMLRLRQGMGAGLLFFTALMMPRLNATPIVNSLTGLANPASLFTFDEIAIAGNTPLTNQFAAYGITFENLFYDTSARSYGTSIAYPLAVNFSNNNTGETNNPYSIHFATTQTDAAFGLMWNQHQSTTFTALLGGVVVDSYTVDANYHSPDGLFFGFTGLSGFDEISLYTTGGVDGYALLDNIQMGTAAGAVPESGNAMMLGLGIASLLSMRRFRSARLQR